MKKAPTFHRRLRRRLNFSQNFRKPRAFGAQTPLLGAFGPQKWEYPPPTLAEKNLGSGGGQGRTAGAEGAGEKLALFSSGQ